MSLHDARDDGRDVHRAFMSFICNVPESALREKEWWGSDNLQPAGFSIDAGDCMPLDDTYYCLERLVHGESATFRAAYKKPTHRIGNLERIP